MSSALKYLEDLQGLILFNKKVYGISGTLKKWIEDLSDEDFENKIIEFRNEFHRHFDVNVYENRRDIHKIILLKDMQDKILKENPDITNEKLEGELSLYLENLSKSELHFSKFERIDQLIIIKNLQEILVDSAKRLGLLINQDIACGTISTGGINACTFGLESGDRLILIEHELLTLLLLTTKVIVKSFVHQSAANGKIQFSINPQDVKALVEDNATSEALSRFKELIVSFVKGSINKAEPYELSNEILLDLASVILNGAEVFIIGHEYGHIVKEHNNLKKKIFYFNPSENSNLPAYDKEFEADIIGLNIVLDHISQFNFEKDFQYVGVEIFFIIHEITSKALSIYSHGVETSTLPDEKHPPYHERINRLRTALSANSDKEQYNNAIYFSNSIREILEYFWIKTKPVVLNMYLDKGK